MWVEKVRTRESSNFDRRLGRDPHVSSAGQVCPFAPFGRTGEQVAFCSKCREKALGVGVERGAGFGVSVECASMELAEGKLSNGETYISTESLLERGARQVPSAKK